MSSYLLSGAPQAFEPSVFTTDTNPRATVGQFAFDTTGDKYRYVKASEAISAGELVVAPSPKTTASHNVDVNTAVIGDLQVTITAGAEAITADEFAGGTLIVNAGTAIGEAYPIVGNDAITSAGGATIIRLGTPIRTNFGASDKVTLVHNPANGVQTSTSSTLEPVGIAVTDIASGSYGWVKTWGITPALADETLTLGAWLTSGTSVAGAVEELDDVTAPITDNLVGYAVVAGVDTETRPIFVTIG